MKKRAQMSKELEEYLSRDLRQVIRDVLSNYQVAPTKQLVDDIYELVMVEVADVQFRAVESKLDRIVERVYQATQ